MHMDTPSASDYWLDADDLDDDSSRLDLAKPEVTIEATRTGVLSLGPGTTDSLLLSRLAAQSARPPSCNGALLAINSPLAVAETSLTIHSVAWWLRHPAPSDVIGALRSYRPDCLPRGQKWGWQYALHLRPAGNPLGLVSLPEALGEIAELVVRHYDPDGTG